MPVNHPTRSDPQIAAATFRQHLDDFWLTGRPTSKGWGRIELDEMQTVIALPGIKSDGWRDWYFVKLGAEYYDAAPPTATFVSPADWSDAPDNSRWFPVLDQLPGWFGLHGAYDYKDKSKRQLICCSMVAQFYMTDHAPKATEIWQQGKDTVAATINRLAAILGPAHYRRPKA